jgi:hypothetical protein
MPSRADPDEQASRIGKTLKEAEEGWARGPARTIILREGNRRKRGGAARRRKMREFPEESFLKMPV